MDVRNAPEWPRSLVFGVVLVALATLSSVPVISAAETRKTFEDRFAERDIRDAAQDVDQINSRADFPNRLRVNSARE